MKLPVCLATAFCGALLVPSLLAQSPATRQQIEKATRQIIPSAIKVIEDQTSAKIEIEIDTASFGDDEKAWGNLHLVVNRLVGALSEVGKDQVGKDAIVKSVKKAAIVKLPAEAQEDVVEIKDGTVTVRTTASDDAMALLQNVIVATLEKELQLK